MFEVSYRLPGETGLARRAVVSANSHDEAVETVRRYHMVKSLDDVITLSVPAGNLYEVN